MKRQPIQPRKLTLRTETVRSLDQAALVHINGGATVLTFHTLRTCVDCTG